MSTLLLLTILSLIGATSTATKVDLAQPDTNFTTLSVFMVLRNGKPAPEVGVNSGDRYLTTEGGRPLNKLGQMFAKRYPYSAAIIEDSDPYSQNPRFVFRRNALEIDSATSFLNGWVSVHKSPGKFPRKMQPLPAEEDNIFGMTKACEGLKYNPRPRKVQISLDGKEVDDFMRKHSNILDFIAEKTGQVFTKMEAALMETVEDILLKEDDLDPYPKSVKESLLAIENAYYRFSLSTPALVNYRSAGIYKLMTSRLYNPPWSPVSEGNDEEFNTPITIVSGSMDTLANIWIPLEFDEVDDPFDSELFLYGTALVFEVLRPRNRLLQEKLENDGVVRVMMLPDSGEGTVYTTTYAWFAKEFPLSKYEEGEKICYTFINRTHSQVDQSEGEQEKDMKLLRTEEL